MDRELSTFLAKAKVSAVIRAFLSHCESTTLAFESDMASKEDLCDELLHLETDARNCRKVFGAVGADSRDDAQTNLVAHFVEYVERAAPIDSDHRRELVELLTTLGHDTAATDIACIEVTT